MERHRTALEAKKENGISLHDVIEDLMILESIYATEKGNIISNEVESDIQIFHNSKKIKSVLKRILGLIINVTRKSHINISAKAYTNLVLIHFKEDNIENISRISIELKQMSPEAEKLGGVLGVTTHLDKLATIAFTFMNGRNFPRTYPDGLARTISEL